jgi:hypothetical protein
MKNLLHFITLVLLIGCNSEQKSIHVFYTEDNIMYEGRIGENLTNNAAEIYWAGTSIKINFKGTDVKVTLDDEYGANYFNVIIDGVPSQVLKLETGLKTYLIANELSNGLHTIELTKRNEWTYGKTLFHHFEIAGELLRKDDEKSIFIEFYGDSISVGHGNEDYTGEDKLDGSVTNNYNTYAAMTARNINADYSCIARSGIGIMVSWFNMIMPEMYYRLDPTNSDSKWNFSKKKPDIVVINLLQNDSWIINNPNHEEFKRRFGNQKPNKEKIILDYTNFIKSIRGKYQKSDIVCMLGNMDITKKGAPWANYVEAALERLEDPRIHTCFVPYKNTSGHPKVKEHEKMAIQLTRVINENILNRI